MKGSCRSHNGRDPGVHTGIPAAASLVGSCAGCPTGAPFLPCNYCTQIHQDPHVQNLYPLRPEQHAQHTNDAAAAAAAASATGQPAGKPTEIFLRDKQN